MTADHKTFNSAENDFYCARDAKQSKAVLRTLKSFDDYGIVLPSNTWPFAAMADEKSHDARCGIALDHAAASNTYYRLVYEGESPAVAGMGEAAFRDFAAYLKNRNEPSNINNRLGDA